MKFEKEYIQYLIETAKTDSRLSPILDEYFLDTSTFEEVVDKISSELDNITTYQSFDKSRRLDDLLDL